MTDLKVNAHKNSNELKYVKLRKNNVAFLLFFFLIIIIIYYFHVNGSIGIVQKIDFEIRPDLGCTTPKTSRKVVLDDPSVCLSVCLSGRLSVLLSLFPRALTGVRLNRSS